jgi:hypothetical protein
MSEVLFSGGPTALAECPVAGDDEFVLDVRVVVAYGPVMGDCPTDDGPPLHPVTTSQHDCHLDGTSAALTGPAPQVHEVTSTLIPPPNFPPTPAQPKPAVPFPP